MLTLRQIKFLSSLFSNKPVHAQKSKEFRCRRTCEAAETSTPHTPFENIIRSLWLRHSSTSFHLYATIMNHPHLKRQIKIRLSRKRARSF